MSDHSAHRTQLSRRAFHGAVAAAVGAAACDGLPLRTWAQAPPVGEYIDMHVHLGQPWFAGPPLTADILLRWMDEHRVARAVVLPLISPEAWYYPITTEWVLEQTKPHRDRLIPFCDVDPRTDYLGGPKGILEILQRYVDAGAQGLGEHKCGGPIDSPGNLRVFRAAGELGLPVLFHADNIRNTDQPGLPGLEKVLREVPGCVFIGHATTFWSSISGDVTAETLGGYPKGPIAPGGALDRLMDRYPNLYGEISAGSGANAIQRDLKAGREFVLRRGDRLLFGTDNLAVGQKIPQFELIETLALPPDVKRKICRGNAERVLARTK